MTVAEDVLLIPLLAVCLVGACALWVLHDARERSGIGRPVGLQVGNLQVDRPETWACACLLMWIFFFPLYLRARSES
jgi:hypothetical protein